MKDRGLLDIIVSLLPGLKPAERLELLKVIDSEEQLYLKQKRYFEEIINREIKDEWDINGLRDKADRIDTMCKMRAIKWVSWPGADYPPLLRESYDPPAVLYYKGILPNPEKSLLGMVGTRKPSPEAASQAFSIACGAGKAGISVVSGLALGIDSMSHRGNLAGGVPGYAVLGSGPDEISPQTNKPLAKKILDSGGAIISEYPPGTHAYKGHFPARNRIISALSRSVLIVEAPAKSGALITAAFALEQGKDLWVSSTGIQPGSALCDRRGTVKLMGDGAEIIYSERDIFEKWNLEIAHDTADAKVPMGKEDYREIIFSMAGSLKIDV
jgi:DNA processing protein